MEYKCKKCGSNLLLEFSGSTPLITDDKYKAVSLTTLNNALRVRVICGSCNAENCNTGYYVEGDIEGWPMNWEPRECY